MSMAMKYKINLFNKLYKEISDKGIKGDTELAHINKYEAAVLKAMGGSGTVNSLTGLKQYYGGDDPAPAPAATTTTVKQVSDLPEYFKPYVEELFATAQDVYEKPYKPYEGERLAGVTTEQKTAFQGLSDMFTQVDPETGTRSFRDPSAVGFKEAERLSARGAKGFDELTEGEFQETYMSPYQSAVTDIQKREASRIQEQNRQKRQGAARMANALGGGRYGAETAAASFLDQQLLDDIQKKGLQDAYTQGISVFDTDRAAARAGATQQAGLTTDAFASQLKGLGALQSTGETQRAIAQQPLDIKYEEFARQQNFPKQNLQELSGILRGFQVQPTTYNTTQAYKAPQSLGQQLLAAGTLGAGISKGLGQSLLGASSNKKGGGSVNAAGGGLMSIAPQKYQTGKKVEAIPGDKIPPEALQFMPPELLQRLDSQSLPTPTTAEEIAAQALKDLQPGQGRTDTTTRPDWARYLTKVDYEKVLKSMIPQFPDDKGDVDEFTEINVEEKPTDAQSETAVTESTTSDSDSGFDFQKLLTGYGEGFDAAAPYLASWAKQMGYDDTGLEGIAKNAMTKAQTDYYKSLALKTKAYEAIEKAKAGRELNKVDRKLAMEGAKALITRLTKKQEFGDELTETEQRELDSMKAIIGRLIRGGTTSAAPSQSRSAPK